ncbi:MAG TPA: hypothetical protein VMJ32_14780 [Pirellulales bacterium]|nr:hypothetical protein [Pirellulales bacterium]
MKIDAECSSLRNGTEHGLVNVKLEFQDQAFNETGKYLTEELLIAWLLRKKLRALNRNVEPSEIRYPGTPTNKKCDIVMHLSDSHRLWLEIKLAWKSWFNCVGPPTYANRAYLTYLNGRDRTHSLRHDFEKLANANLPAGDCRCVCLIGFDCVANPMDGDVASVVQQVSETASWQLRIERHWVDRRAHEFRLNVWIWSLEHIANATKAVIRDNGVREIQKSQTALDHKRALAIIEQFVMNEPWGVLWDGLVRELIEPLGLADLIGNINPSFCEAAASNIRSHWPDSWNNADLWKSRRGPWTSRDGKLKIIEIVRKSARDFIP